LNPCFPIWLTIQSHVALAGMHSTSSSCTIAGSTNTSASACACRDAFNEFIVHQRRLNKYICIWDMLQTWFWNAPLEQIKRGNVADLITYGFWYKSRCVSAYVNMCVQARPRLQMGKHGLEHGGVQEHAGRHFLLMEPSVSPLYCFAGIIHAQFADYFYLPILWTKDWWLSWARCEEDRKSKCLFAVSALRWTRLTFKPGVLCTSIDVQLGY